MEEGRSESLVFSLLSAHLAVYGGHTWTRRMRRERVLRAVQRKSILARERETRNEKCIKLRFYRIARTARSTTIRPGAEARSREDETVLLFARSPIQKRGEREGELSG